MNVSKEQLFKVTARAVRLERSVHRAFQSGKVSASTQRLAQEVAQQLRAWRHRETNRRLEHVKELARKLPGTVPGAGELLDTLEGL